MAKKLIRQEDNLAEKHTVRRRLSLRALPLALACSFSSSYLLYSNITCSPSTSLSYHLIPLPLFLLQLLLCISPAFATPPRSIRRRLSRFVTCTSMRNQQPRAAKDSLGWKGNTNLPEDLKERYEEYVKIRRDKQVMEFSLDDKIADSLKVPVAARVAQTSHLPSVLDK